MYHNTQIRRTKYDFFDLVALGGLYLMQGNQQGWRNDFRGGGTRFQGAQGAPPHTHTLKTEKALDFTNYLSRKPNLTKL